jgi:hypothetical protein
MRTLGDFVRNDLAFSIFAAVLASALVLVMASRARPAGDTFGVPILSAANGE